MKFPKHVNIHEVCPRDGWQRYQQILPTDVKIDLIKSMIDYGCNEIELGVFSKIPKLTRQYQDMEVLAAAILPYAKAHGVKITSLVNDYEDACRSLDAGISDVSCFLSVSEEFAKGFDTTAEKSFADLAEITKLPSIKVTLALGAVFGSPFGDETPASRSIDYARRGIALGASAIGLADSAGMGTPAQIKDILTKFLDCFSPSQLSVHLHNTEGFGIANTYAALECGITDFDTSLGAMGGCPVIPNAKGNIATEDFVNLLDKLGIGSDVDMEKCVAASLEMSRRIGNPVISAKAELAKVQQ